MRKYYDIQLADRKIAARELTGEAIVKAGRYLIAKTLLELGAATVDPLSPANPLIFSAGPFAGSSFSNANRTSVGCKSPLTGGVKEANGYAEPLPPTDHVARLHGSDVRGMHDRLRA